MHLIDSILRALNLQRIQPPKWDVFDPQDNPGAGHAQCAGCGKVYRCDNQYNLEPHICTTIPQTDTENASQGSGST